MTDIIEKILRIISDAGRIMLSAELSSEDVSEKSSFRDLVTVYDTKIQDYLTEKISGIVPNAKFFAEESSEKGSISADELFIIDPIDGTANFVHGLNYSAVSVAWYKGGKPFFGAVYNPFTDEFYRAVIGEGAFKNGKRLKLDKNISLKDSIAVFGTSPYNIEKKDETFELIKSIYGNCRDIRRFGSAALDICHVADSSTGLYFEASLFPWDYAAAAVILNEAGGLLTDFAGNEIFVDGKKTSVAAGGEKILSEFYGFVKKAYRL